jgi:hypothetical protein
MPVGSARFRIVYLGQPIGAGVSEGVIVSVHAVAKKNGPKSPYCVANEVVCGEIGRFLGLPIPPAGVVYSPKGNDLFFASLDFNLTGNTLPPLNATKCVQVLPDISTGVLLFDILIANSDRHGRNLSVDFSTKPPAMNVFDHGHALLGSVQGQAVNRLEKLSGRLGISAGSRTAGNRHCLLDQVNTDTHFGHWIERIRLIPDYVIKDLCGELPGLGCSQNEADAAAEFLKGRCQRLQQIVEENKAEFTGIRTWRLFR